MKSHKKNVEQLESEISELKNKIKSLENEKTSNISKNILSDESSIYDEFYLNLFEESPISIWEEDFSLVKNYLDELRINGLTDFREYFKTKPEEITKLCSLIKVINVNKATLELYKAESKNVFYQGLRSFFTIESFPVLKEEILALLENSNRFESSIWSQKLNGEKMLLTLIVSVPPAYEKTWSRVMVSMLDITQKTSAEKEIRKSKEEFERFFTLIPVLSCIAGADGYFKKLNPVWIETLGYSIEELLSTPFDTFIHPDDIEPTKNGLSKTLNEKTTINLLTRFRCKDGLYRLLEWKVTPAPDSLFYAVARDITEQKIAEDKLKESEEKFHRLAEIIPVGVYMTDEKGDCLYSNQKWQEMTGITFENALGTGWRKGIYYEDRDKFFNNWQKMVESKGRWGMEFRAKSSCGKMCFIWGTATSIEDSEGRVIGYVGANTDITHRKIIENNLQISEKRYHTLFRNMLEGSAYCETVFEHGKPVDFIYLEVNENFEKITGLKNVQGKSAAEIMPGIRKSYPVLREIFEKAILNLTSVRVETYFDFLNLWLSISVYPIDKSCFITFLEDISERKRSENALSESEAKYRIVADNTFDWEYWMDPENNFIYISPSCKNISGYSSIEFQSDPELFFKIIHPDDKELCLKHSKSIEIDQDAHTGIEYRIIHADGSIRYISHVCQPVYNSEGNYLGVRGSNRDISEKTRTEKALSESQAQFRFLVDNAPVAIYIQTGGNFVYLNNSAVKLLGAESAKQLINQPVLERIVPELREFARERIKQLNEAKKGVPKMEHQYLRLDGTLVNVEVLAIPINYDEKDGALVFIHDLTDLKKTVEERVKLQKLESLSVIAGGIAHDFNNIMTSIQGHVSMVLEDITEVEIRESLVSVERAIKRAVGLTKQLLTFARGSSTEKCEIFIRKIIKDIALFSLSGSNIDVEFNFNDTLPLEADPAQIAQVIQNIVINSKQAMLSGGIIKISTEDFYADKEIPVVKIIISDSGCGINSENLTRIFDPYFSTKENGSGLGLSVCYSIIKTHQGKILVDSVVNEGTTMTIILPSSMKKRITKNDESLITNEKYSCLLMDDENDVLEMLASMLVKLGLSVMTAQNGEQALFSFKKSLETGLAFDLVFLDLTVKRGMGGKETVRKIKELNSKVRIIVTSGYSEDDTLSRYKDYGFDAKLVKPYTKTDLKIAIRDAVSAR